jgi:hypothetical protein
MTNLNIGGDFAPWQLAFFAVGAPGILLAVVLLFIPEPTRKDVLRTADGEAIAKVPFKEALAYLWGRRRLYAPIYIGVIFILHPWLGAFAFGCAIVLVLMALLNEHLVKGPLSEANEAASRNYGFTDMSLRNAEVVQAMGMMPGLLHRWSRDRNLLLDRLTQAIHHARRNRSKLPFAIFRKTAKAPNGWRHASARPFRATATPR